MLLCKPVEVITINNPAAGFITSDYHYRLTYLVGGESLKKLPKTAPESWLQSSWPNTQCKWEFHCKEGASTTLVLQ
jgi:hypothetical protein